MDEREHIIAIRNRDINEATEAFREFMTLSENCLNDKARQSPREYSKSKPKDLETITVNAMKETCHATPFRESDIKLVSGQAFPDIVAAGHYGVEVKSTKGKSWKSTGSSIVESTRVEDIDRIYMMFGCLGGNPPSFKCKPYEQCLYDIAVTHSPRYLIDMNIKEREDIFSKMNSNYDEFRRLSEDAKITQVRNYYKAKAKAEKKKSIPWWMNDSTNVMLSFYTDLDLSMKCNLKCRALILFPDLFASDTSNAYKDVALWLCNRYSILNNSLRDMFSAGGQVRYINGVKLEKEYPAIVRRLLCHNVQIKSMLNDPDDMLREDIAEYGAFEGCSGKDFYEKWLYSVEKQFSNNPDLSYISIRELLETNAQPT